MSSHMSTWFYTNDYQLLLKIVKFKKVGQKRSVYMKNLECSLIANVVNLGFIMVQIYLHASN